MMGPGFGAEIGKSLVTGMLMLLAVAFAAGASCTACGGWLARKVPYQIVKKGTPSP